MYVRNNNKKVGVECSSVTDLCKCIACFKTISALCVCVLTRFFLVAF